jgi:hypothetical protein
MCFYFYYFAAHSIVQSVYSKFCGVFPQKAPKPAGGIAPAGFQNLLFGYIHHAV